MKPEDSLDYVQKLEDALFSYVEQYGPNDKVRRLFYRSGQAETAVNPKPDTPGLVDRTYEGGPGTSGLIDRLLSGRG